MMTEEQRMEFQKLQAKSRASIGQVSEEEMAEFPCVSSVLEVETTQGISRMYRFDPVGIDGGEGLAAPRPLVVNFHGGGFIGGRRACDELFCRRMACTLGATVLDVDYMLAPDNPYPSAVLECWDDLEWIVKNASDLGVDPERIALAGHSAGGNLATGCAMRAAISGSWRPACVVVDYAPFDLYTDPSLKERTSCDMPADRARMYNEKYISTRLAREPYASPLFAPAEMIAGMPDTLVITAGEDSLKCEGEEFALLLARNGVTTVLRRFTDSVHGFVINRMCEWKPATELILSFLTDHLG